MSLNVSSLFSGIGALELGLERAGMTVVGQVELDDLCRHVLARHWPDLPRHDDVRTAGAWWRDPNTERPTVDVVCGGFPCQPFSHSGKLLGVADERWGWPWFADVIRMVEPRYVVVENFAALLRDRDAFGVILAELAELGFDAEWSVLSACAMGAPHTRSRLFVVAHSYRVDGSSRVGARPFRPGQIPSVDHRASAWADREHGVLAASNRRDRVANGTAVGLVAAGGNAVVPAVAEHVGRLIVEHDRARAAA